MTIELEQQAEMLVHKIKHYLITTMGVTLEEANDDEFYRAFSLTLREEIMVNWTATAHTFREKKARVLCYLCMEYMPGRLLGNNITNIHASDLVKLIMKKMNRDFGKILRNEPDPGLGNGGLGRLAACLMDSLATQQYPAVAYGLRYQYGIFDQEVWNGIQVERPDTWLMHENPWEFRKDAHAVTIKYDGHASPRTNKRGEEILDISDAEEVRAICYDTPIIGYKEQGDFNVLTLRLWTTKESPRNFQLQRYNAGLLDQAAENTSLTDVLYPNDNNETGKRIRLKQEFLLASASIQDIFLHYLRHNSDLSNFADRVRLQINDTHPAIVIPEMMRILLQNHDYTWEQARETVLTCCSYTNHTILQESLEEWNEDRLRYLLPRQYHIIERLNLDFCNQVRQKYPGDEERVRRMSIIQGNQVRMAYLAIYGCHKINGVAELHTEILKATLFKDFFEMYPDKFVNVTNGVTQRRWLLHCNPRLADFLTQRIGREWITDFKQIRKIADSAADPKSQEEFLAIKKENKKALIAYLKETNPLRDAKGKVTAYSATLEEDALFDVHIKRIHEYKRQLMNILHTLIVYYELKANPEARSVKRMLIFAGKAAPGYEIAKNIITLIYAVARKINTDPAVGGKLKIAFLEDYNISRAELIIPAADLSQQISTSGLEASGTGNMKLAMNGALTICTEDGSNIEMRKEIGDPYFPFVFGQTSAQNEQMRKNRSYNPWDICMHHPEIRQAVEALRDHSLAISDSEHQAFSNIYRSLLDAQNAEFSDHYFVLNDLPAYYQTQKKVEALFATPSRWAEMALHNIAGMGKFSTDESINNYAKLVWNLDKCPVDPAELAKVRGEYSEHDKCRILGS